MTAPPEVEVDKLPPTLYLFLSALVARYRMGETCWVFAHQCRPAAKRLEDMGLIDTDHGPTEAVFEARFTDAGERLCLSYPYRSPDDKRIAKAVAAELRHMSRTVAASIEDQPSAIAAAAALLARAHELEAGQ